jgi:hypothetical protein
VVAEGVGRFHCRRAYAGLGRLDRQRQDDERARELDPGHAPARELLAQRCPDADGLRPKNSYLRARFRRGRAISQCRPACAARGAGRPGQAGGITEGGRDEDVAVGSAGRGDRLPRPLPAARPSGARPAGGRPGARRAREPRRRADSRTVGARGRRGTPPTGEPHRPDRRPAGGGARPVGRGAAPGRAARPLRRPRAAAAVSFRRSFAGDPWATHVKGTERLLRAKSEHARPAGVPPHLDRLRLWRPRRTHRGRGVGRGRGSHPGTEQSKAESERGVRSGRGVRATADRPSAAGGDSRTGYRSIDPAAFHGRCRRQGWASAAASCGAAARRLLSAEGPQGGDTCVSGPLPGGGVTGGSPRYRSPSPCAAASPS